jgi:AcrR family transcriptional regulator
MRLSKELSETVPLGRPREFDLDTALEGAMLVFWRKGYEGASMSDLTASLGVTKPSLYAAFGAKEELFTAVLDRYDKRTAHFLAGSIHAATAREVAVGLLRGAAEFHANPANPPGCLMVQGALVGSNASDAARRETRNRRDRLREAIQERLERALDEDDLPPGADPGALARYLVAVMRGMAVEAASGASAAEMHEIVDVALTAWPASKEQGRRVAALPRLRSKASKTVSKRSPRS